MCFYLDHGIILRLEAIHCSSKSGKGYTILIEILTLKLILNICLYSRYWIGIWCGGATVRDEQKHESLFLCESLLIESQIIILATKIFAGNSSLNSFKLISLVIVEGTTRLRNDEQRFITRCYNLFNEIRNENK